MVAASLHIRFIRPCLVDVLHGLIRGRPEVPQFPVIPRPVAMKFRSGQMCRNAIVHPSHLMHEAQANWQRCVRPQG